MIATLALALHCIPLAMDPLASAIVSPISSAPRPTASRANALDDADEQYAFIAGLAEKGMHDRVVKEAEAFLAQYPKHPKADAARYRLACALFELKDTEKASAQFQKLASRKGFEFEAEVHFRLGQCQLEAGDCAKAELEFQRAVDAGKDYLLQPARWLLGEAQLRCEKYDAAERSYQAVLEGDAKAADGSGDRDRANGDRGTSRSGGANGAKAAKDSKTDYADGALAGLAWCAFKSKRFDAAAQRSKDFVDRYPRNERADEIRFLLGESLFELGQHKPALQAYASVGQGPWTDGALRGAGFASAALGDHTAAATSFGRVVREFPDSRYVSECALHAGIESLAANDPSTALEILRSKAAGESAEVFAWRSRAEAASGDKEAALKSLDRALELEKDDAAVARLRGQRADLLASLGKSDEAMREYRRAGSDYALQAAAVAALQSGNSADARRAAQELLERFPESTYKNDAHRVLAEADLADKSFDAAREGFVAALRDERDAAKRLRCRSRIAWCLYLGGDPGGAAKAFANLARETGPDAPTADAGGQAPKVAAQVPEIEEAQFMAGRALEAAGDSDAASRAYADYVKQYARGPHAEEAAFRLAKLDTSSDATDRLEAFVRDHPQGELAGEARFELAERLAAAKKPDAAAAQYRALLDTNPDSALAPAASYGLAWCLHEQGDAAGAAGLLRPFLDAKPGDAGADRRDASDARRSGADSDPARAKDSDPGEPRTKDARKGRSKKSAAAGSASSGDIPPNASSTNRDPSARGSANPASTNVDPKLRASALELLVWCEAKLSPPDGVGRAWQAFLGATDDGPRLLHAARAAIEPLRKSGRTTDAVAILDALAARAKELRLADPAFLCSLSVERVYLDLADKRVDDADQELERAARARPDDAGVAEAAFFLGEARLEQGDGPGAVSLYEFSAKNAANPARDRALYKSGFAKLKAGDAAGAEGSFASLVKSQPKSPLLYESLFLLGESQYRQKEYEKACTSLERVRKEAPRHEVLPKVLFRLGLARCELEDWKGALEALAALGSAKPEFENLAEAELARGRALAHLDRSREAQSAFERTLALDKGVLAARAHLEIARLHFQAKAYEPALSEFLKVAVLYDLPEETAQALLGAGQTLEAQGDVKRAAEQYKEVVEKHGDSSAAEPAKRRLAELDPRPKRGA